MIIRAKIITNGKNILGLLFTLEDGNNAEFLTQLIPQIIKPNLCKLTNTIKENMKKNELFDDIIFVMD